MTRHDIQKRLQAGHRSRLSSARKQVMRDRLVAQMEAEDQTDMPIQKIPIKRRRRPIAPYTYSAAALVVAVGIATSLTLSNRDGHTPQSHEMMSTSSGASSASSTSGTTSATNGSSFSTMQPSPFAGPTKSSAGLARSDKQAPNHSVSAQNAAAISSLVMSGTGGWYLNPTGQLLHTQNGGNTWHNVTPPGANLSKDRLTSENFTHGSIASLAVQQGVHARVYWTMDGGQHWTEQTRALSSNTTISQMIVLNRSLGIAAVTGSGGQAETFQLWRTNDGGQHWSTLNTSADGRQSDPSLFSNVGNRVMSFATTGIGYRLTTTASGPSGTGIDKTADGGRTWQAWKPNLPVPAKLRGDTRQPFQIPYLFGLKGVWPVIYSDGANDQSVLEVYRTANAGQSWTAMTPVPVQNGTSVDFVSPQTGWRINPATNQFWQTSDGGSHWHSTQSGVPMGTLTSISPVNATKAYALLSHAGQSPQLAVTTNGGKSWRDKAVRAR